MAFAQNLPIMPRQPVMAGQQASPSLKLFLKRLGRSFIYRILPVPVVFLLTAFWLQLTAYQERPCSALSK